MPGWINVDRRRVPGVALVADVAAGLPLADASCDGALALHVLQDLPYPRVVPALGELARVLRPGAVLRLGLPDLDRAIDAYRRGDHAYFCVPDADARSIGAKLVTQLVWYGTVRTPFTYDCIAELLGRAGFGAVTRCAFGVTHSRAAALAAHDNRPRETLFVEASRP